MFWVVLLEHVQFWRLWMHRWCRIGGTLAGWLVKTERGVGIARANNPDLTAALYLGSQLDVKKPGAAFVVTKSTCDKQNDMNRQRVCECQIPTWLGTLSITSQENYHEISSNSIYEQRPHNGCSPLPTIDTLNGSLNMAHACQHRLYKTSLTTWSACTWVRK